MKNVLIVLVVIIVGVAYKLSFVERHIKKDVSVSTKELVRVIEDENKVLVLGSLSVIGEGLQSEDEVLLIRNMWEQNKNIFSSRGLNLLMIPEVRIEIAKLLSQMSFNRINTGVRSQDVYEYVREVLTHSANKDELEPAIISLRYYDRNEDVTLLMKFILGNEEELSLLATETLLFMCNDAAVEQVENLPKKTEWLKEKINKFKVDNNWCSKFGEFK
jgi:hypothetical protein